MTPQEMIQHDDEVWCRENLDATAFTIIRSACNAALMDLPEQAQRVPRELFFTSIRAAYQAGCLAGAQRVADKVAAKLGGKLGRSTQ